MKKIFLASIIAAATGTVVGAASVHLYYWISVLKEDAERMREIDADFDDMADLYYADEAEEVEYNGDDDEG